jgi:hypothetical protein
MSSIQLERPASAGLRVWPRWPFAALLAVLFCGPLIAPLLQATGLPLLAGSGALARSLLASYICPTPAKSYVLLGFPMAVCARCWGATVGLWAGWGLFAWLTSDQRPAASDQGAAAQDKGRRTQDESSIALPLYRSTALPLRRWLALPWPARLALAALPFLLWAAEIAWWPGAPYAALLLNGAQAGLWAGLFFCSIWPGLAAAPQTPG